MLSFSHCLLATQVYRAVKQELGLKLNYLQLCFGSIKPDFDPVMRKLDHTKSASFNLVQQEIAALAGDNLRSSCGCKDYSQRLGIILHFIADYFCFAHNNLYLQTHIWQHFIYECRLGKCFLQLLLKKSLIPIGVPLQAADDYDSAELVEQRHRVYLAAPESNPLKDVQYIIQTCGQLSLRQVAQQISSPKYGLPAFKKIPKLVWLED